MPGISSAAGTSPAAKPDTIAPNKTLTVSTSKLDIEKAVEHLVSSNTGSASRHHCLRAVRQAIEAGGVSLKTRVANAKDAGPSLVEVGFSVVSSAGYTPRKGDVAVIQNYQGGSVAGHICMYSGEAWISDFVQTDMWSGPGYRTSRPPFKIYRP
ncbi:hypothetical protein OPKNFCMD_2712 [Methylobacterium crusticola]|uniref:CHAP domain-containing protein n=1 Tax=Methylobacterium crusticola TaxID=1697972 RepID=A0ABQ4QY49_9HYPH|nr:hypothetical protein [Methylobacterium crusticola]GJD49976.1 hypothetical protein OPKNFCMD_2712 [Methylobacterium crusticola]